MRKEVIVKYCGSWPVDKAEVVAGSERKAVNLDKLLEEGATIKHTWIKAGWRVFVLHNEHGINI